MEAGEGVTMTNNVAVPVGNVNVSENMVRADAGQNFKPVVSETPGADNREVADGLLDEAKDWGVDAALERFADEEVWEPDEEDDIVDETVAEPDTEEMLPKEEADPITEKVQALENKVSEVLKQNAELRHNLEVTQKNLQMAVESIYAMAVAIREMAEDEDDELKKMSILEILFEIVGRLMQAMVVPQEDDGVMQGVDPEKQKEEKIVTELFRRVEKPAA